MKVWLIICGVMATITVLNVLFTAADGTITNSETIAAVFWTLLFILFFLKNKQAKQSANKNDRKEH